MEEGKKRLWLRAPSPAMVVAIIALVFAMTGTGFAATKLVKGDSLIKKNSLSGNRLKAKTVPATKIGALPGARVRSNTTQSIPNMALTPLTFNRVDFNNGAVFNAANPTRLTARVAGVYVITASIAWANDAAGFREVHLRVNGSADIAAESSGPTTGNSAPQQSIVTTFHLNKGDYVEATVWQTSGAALESWNADYSAPLFTMNWISQ